MLSTASGGGAVAQLWLPVVAAGAVSLRASWTDCRLDWTYYFARCSLLGWELR